MVKVKMNVYSHGAHIHGYTSETFRHIASFLERLSLKTEERRPHHEGGGLYLLLKKRFFGMTEDGKNVFIHKHSVDDFLHFLKTYGITSDLVDITYIEPPQAAPATFNIFDFYVERDHQKYLIPEMSDDVPSRRVDLYTGGGKDQPLNALIKIPGGWKRMGDIVVGDIVTAPDGTPTTVSGVHPQGRKLVYDIVMADGRRTQAGADHLWKVFLPNGNRWKVMTTVEMKWYVERKQSRTYIPLVSSELNGDIELPLDPYVLGVILGDGGLTTGSAVTISKLDEDLFERVASRLPDAVYIRQNNAVVRTIVRRDVTKTDKNPVVQTLKQLGLMGKPSWEKFVPEIYLHGSHQQRLDLLNGLLDTDGYVGAKDQPNSKRKCGSISYSTTSYKLARDTTYLVRSLGGVAEIVPKDKYFTYKGEKKRGRAAWQVNIRHPKPTTLFTIERKKSRTADDGQYSDRLKLRVSSVQPSETVETQCITVEHPDHLYVTDNFIVTHNTFSALKAASNRGQRFAIMLGPKYFGLWKKAFESTYIGYKEGENPRYISISGSKELKKVIDLAVDGLLDVDVVMIANTTYRNFIDTFEKFGENMKAYGYNATPLNFHATLGLGSQVNDEFQDDPGLAFRIDVFTNVQKQNYLSATPYTGDEFVTAMIDKMLPPYTACTIPKPPKYIDVVELLYTDNVAKTDYLTPFKNTYNHARYEKRMLKAKRRLKEYVEKVAKVVKVMFLKDQQPGQKMLILCATVDFINVLTKYLRMRFPDRNIGFYYQGVAYEKIMDMDIIVSTIKSSGTGVDIPNLRDTFLLHSNNSKKDNIQILGRTRPLLDYPEITPRLIYLTCSNITQHVTYSRNKRDYFRGRVRESRVLRL